MVQQKTKFFSGSYKLIKILAVALVALLFIGSIFLAIFIGGELTPEREVATTKGLIRLTKADYSSSYIVGDRFDFDKEESEVLLVAKDTSLDKVVKIDDLPGPEYGFQVNGEGDICYQAEDITITSDVKFIDLVSRQYPDVKTSLDITVYSSIDESELADSLTMEAENAELYTAAGDLLTQEEKETLPDTNKPYLSSAGESPDGLDCSGGACIRNFSTGMKMKFDFVSSVTGDFDLLIRACKRPSSTEFDSGVTMSVNDQVVKTGATVPAGSGYFEPYEFTTSIHIQRGLNTIIFESIGANCNLDALVLTNEDGSSVFGDSSAIGEIVNTDDESDVDDENEDTYEDTDQGESI